MIFADQYTSCLKTTVHLDPSSTGPLFEYLEYLDADKVMDKVELFYLKYFDVEKMGGQVTKSHCSFRA